MNKPLYRIGTEVFFCLKGYALQLIGTSLIRIGRGYVFDGSRLSHSQVCRLCGYEGYAYPLMVMVRSTGSRLSMVLGDVLLLTAGSKPVCESITVIKDRF